MRLILLSSMFLFFPIFALADEVELRPPEATLQAFHEMNQLQGNFVGKAITEKGELQITLSIFATSILVPMPNGGDVMEIPTLTGYLRSETGTLIVVFIRGQIHSETGRLHMWSSGWQGQYMNSTYLDLGYDHDVKTLKGRIFSPLSVISLELTRDSQP